MAEKYGLICTLKAKEGKIDELVEFHKEHFVKQLDGREPKASCAAIVMPTPEEPNTIRLFEQWDDTEGLEFHRQSSILANWVNTVPDMLVEDAEVIEAPMIFYTKK